MMTRRRMVENNALWAGWAGSTHEDEPERVAVRYNAPAQRDLGTRQCRVCGFAGSTEAVFAHVTRSGHNS